MGKKEFMQLAFQQMRQALMPIDAYNSIDPSAIQMLLVPSYVFKGELEAQWNCRYAGSSEISINDQKARIEPGTPLRGTISSSPFECLVACPVSDATMPWTNEFPSAPLFPSQLGTLNPYSPNALPGATPLPFPQDAMQQWNARGNKVTEAVAIGMAMQSLRNTVNFYEALGVFDPQLIQLMRGSIANTVQSSQPPQVDSWNANTRSRLTDAPVQVYLPVWYLPFNYQGDTYFFFAFALNGVGHMRQLPNPSASDLDSNTARQIAETHKIVTYIKWAALLAVVLLFVANFMTAILYLVVWGGVFGFFYMKLRSLANSAADATAARIGAAEAAIMNRL